MANFNYSLQSLQSTRSTLSEQGRVVLDDLIDYVRGCTYTSRSRAREVMSLHLSGVDLKGIASSLGLSLETVRHIRQRAFRDLTSVLGERFPLLISEDTSASLAEASRILELAREVGTYSLVDQFSPVALALMEQCAEVPPPGFSISEHPEAVSLVLSHSFPSMRKVFGAADPHAIGYLLQLIQGTGGAPDDRKGLKSALDRLSH